MGSRHSTASQRERHMLPSPFHYHPISPSNSPTQPLLQDYNQHSMFQNLEAKAQEENTAALERENGVLSSVVSSLESKLLSKERDTDQVKCRNTNLESEVNELKAHVAELYSQLKHGKDEKTKLKEAIKKVKKRYAALEDKLEKVSTNIAEMKTASSHHSLNAVPVVSSDATMPQSETTSPKMDVEIPNKENDIAACLVVLIILVSILVGINL